ncbi:MAG: hypothetical protein HW421_2805 [Ignavibacteria bacterium]|nr:hypothetical protein [Ignavibacteria bacterium]
MAKKLKIWYDKEGDFLEVLLSDAPGYMIETENDNVLQRVDESGNIIGYSFIGISKMKNDIPIYTELEFA